jgi:small-conductance mechanosensitive channel
VLGRGLALAADAQSVACGPRGDRAWLCTTTYRITGSQDAAEVADALAKPLRIVLIIVLAWVIARVLRRSVTRAAQRLRDQPRASAFFDNTTDPSVLDDLARRRHAQRVDTIAAVLRSVVGVLVWAVAALVVLADLGVDLAPLLASAGVATVVIGFGAQQVVRDYLAGLSMLLEDQFGVGDVVDMGEASGTVESVSLRVTRLRDVEGVVWWIPNGQVTRVGNKSQQWSRALLDIAVAPDTEIERATEIIKRTADEMWRDEHWRDRMLDEPEVWGVEDVGIGGILIRLVVKTVPLEQWNVSRELRARLKRAFDAAGIRLPVQQQQITYEMGGSPPPAGADATAPDAEGT